MVGQFSPVEDVAVLVTIGVVTAEDVRIGPADAQVPAVTTEVVIDFSVICEDVLVVIVFRIDRAVSTKVQVACADTVGNGRAIVDLGIGADTNAVIPRIIIAVVCVVALMLITNAGIAGQFDVADFLFQVRNANTQAVQFVSEFISQFVDESALFHRGFVHVGHGFSCHFGCFVTCNVTVAFEMRAIYALDDAFIGQFYDGVVSPGIGRYVDEGIGSKGAGRTEGHRRCEG